MCCAHCSLKEQKVQGVVACSRPLAVQAAEEEEHEVPPEDTSKSGAVLDSRDQDLKDALGPVCSNPLIHVGLRSWMLLWRYHTAMYELSLLQRLQADAWKLFKEVCWARFGSLRPCIAARHVCRRAAAAGMSRVAAGVMSGAGVGSGNPSPVGRASSGHAAAGGVNGTASNLSKGSTSGAGGPASSNSDAEAMWMATRFICAFIDRACPLKTGLAPQSIMTWYGPQIVLLLKRTIKLPSRERLNTHAKNIWLSLGCNDLHALEV
eukprot:1147416-Pelagomonas_calceolata.AAC.8